MNGAEPQLLYIMGMGRSGTTILEILLSSGDDAVGLGEATYVFEDGFQAGKACTCGASVHDCVIWGELARELEANEASQAQRVLRTVERHVTFPFTALGLLPQRLVDQYVAFNRRLYAAVAEASRASWLIDASKYAGRAVMMDRIRPRTKVLCIVRHPAAVIASFRKRGLEQPPKSAAMALLYYAYTLACLWWVVRRHHTGALVIAYEDLLADPESVLARIESWSGMDLADARRRVREHDVLTPGHIVTGNRLRFRTDLRFRREDPSPPPAPLGISIPARWLDRLRTQFVRNAR